MGESFSKVSVLLSPAADEVRQTVPDLSDIDTEIDYTIKGGKNEEKRPKLFLYRDFSCVSVQGGRELALFSQKKPLHPGDSFSIMVSYTYLKADRT